MTENTCHGCGEPIEPSRGGGPRKWCSERCRKAQYGGVCEGCGTPTNGSNGAEAAAKVCGVCHVARHADRNRRIFAAWAAGETARTIGARENMTEGRVLSLIDCHRRLKGEPIPHHKRPRRELWPYIEREWNAGATAPEIAVECSTTPSNVFVMIRNMRAAGIEMRRGHG